MNYWYVLISAIIVMLASVSGVFFLQKNAQTFIEKKLPFLISFSAGVFFLISVHMIFGSVSIYNSWLLTGGFVVVGFIAAWLLTKLLPETHHHHDSCCAKKKHTAYKVVFGDMLHNVADGLFLTISFAVSPALGLASLVSIFIHEFLQEVSEFFVLKQAGYSTRKAVIVNFCSSATILVGVMLGALFVDNMLLKAIMVAVSAGFFLNVVFADLFPHRHKVDSNREFLIHLVLLVVGMLLMFLVMHLSGHGK